MIYQGKLANKGESQSDQFKLHWLLLIVCGVWILATLEHRGWVDITYHLLSIFWPSWLDIGWVMLLAIPAALFSILFTVVSLLLAIATLGHIGKKRPLRAVGPLFLLSGTLLIMFFMPTKATLLLRRERERLEAIVAQAEITRVRQASLDELPQTRVLMKQMPDVAGRLRRYREADPDILCLSFREDDVNVKLLHSSTGQYEDCREWESALWTRRIYGNWFETSSNPSLLLWFLNE